MNLLPWLSLSSELNPVENEWGELKRISTAMELWIWRIWRDSVWKWSLISYQVFSKLFRHYRRKLRAHTLEKDVEIIGCQYLWPTWTRESIYFTMRFPPHFQLFYFNDRLEFFEWKIKRINNADLFSQPPLLILTTGANISGVHCKGTTFTTKYPTSTDTNKYKEL